MTISGLNGFYDLKDGLFVTTIRDFFRWNLKPWFKQFKGEENY